MTQSLPPKSEAIKEIDVLWLTAGLSCDGDTITITAATQPSLEEILLGGIPGIPKVRFHNPFLSFENGDEFVEFLHKGADGRIDRRDRFDAHGFWRNAHS